MSAKVVWKEALLLGSFEDRHGNKLTFDRPYLQRADRNVGLMLSRGVPVPCTWEHQAIDITSPADQLAAYAKYTFGHLVGRRFNQDGNLELALEVPDEADRRQLAKVRFVSPKIFNGFRDSKGNRYDGPVIGHLAATPTPVQFGQKPFTFELGDSRGSNPGASPAAVRRDLFGRVVVRPTAAGLDEVLQRQASLARMHSTPTRQAR